VPEVVGAGGGDVDGEGLLGLEEGVDECELDFGRAFGELVGRTELGGREKIILNIIMSVFYDKRQYFLYFEFLIVF